MPDLIVTPADVRPLPGAVCRNMRAHVALNLGDAVYIEGVEGECDKADAGAAGTAMLVGIVVAVGTEGALAAAANDPISVLLWGPVQGFSGMTPGAWEYLSDTAGALADAVGTVPVVAGIALAADVLLFRPQRDLIV